MKKDKLIKNTIVLVSLTILILIIDFIICSVNLNNLINYGDSFTKLIGSFSSLILPYIIIAIVIQSVELSLLLINRKNYIVNLIVEIIYFLFTNFAVVPFMFFNLLSINKLLAYLLILIFELINIYIFILMIKRIIITKKLVV